MAPDLDVAFLEDVEQADLDALGEVGQLVYGEDAAVGPRHEAVVQRELVGEVAALGHLDRVDLADEISHGGVRGGELLAVTVAAVDPGDRGVLARLRHQVPGHAGDGPVGIVVDLRTGHDRQPFVQKAHERADHAALCLPPFAEEDHVMTCDESMLEGRQDAVAVTEHVGNHGLSLRDPDEDVAADLLFDRYRVPPRGAQLAEGRRQ